MGLNSRSLQSRIVTFLNPYVFNWRTNEHRLLCLKYRGSTFAAKLSLSRIAKDSPFRVQLTVDSNSLLASRSQVLRTNGVVPRGIVSNDRLGEGGSIESFCL